MKKSLGFLVVILLAFGYTPVLAQNFYCGQVCERIITAIESGKCPTFEGIPPEEVQDELKRVFASPLAADAWFDSIEKAAPRLRVDAIFRKEDAFTLFPHLYFLTKDGMEIRLLENGELFSCKKIKGGFSYSYNLWAKE
ncbi:MAG TPA: hypothetical protein PKA31_02160 [Candidatus Moranbacteria bacterium]|nr:hypothetical protein [Candidatus Moranbacteria bacterium]